MRWWHLLLMLVLMLLLLLWRRRRINKLRWLRHGMTSSSSPTSRLRRGPFVLPGRGLRRLDLVRHEPWTVTGGRGRIRCRHHRRREAPMVADAC